MSKIVFLYPKLGFMSKIVFLYPKVGFMSKSVIFNKISDLAYGRFLNLHGEMEQNSDMVSQKSSRGF
jgi:hypothetical protein